MQMKQVNSESRGEPPSRSTETLPEHMVVELETTDSSGVETPEGLKGQQQEQG